MILAFLFFMFLVFITWTTYDLIIMLGRAILNKNNEREDD